MCVVAAIAKLAYYESDQGLIAFSGSSMAMLHGQNLRPAHVASAVCNAELGHPAVTTHVENAICNAGPGCYAHRTIHAFLSGVLEVNPPGIQDAREVNRSLPQTASDDDDCI